jgi:hypothetical protein
MNSADLCRQNGWTVGTILEGCEKRRPSKIVITAIGETSVLARQIDDDNSHTEHSWDLSWRDWKFEDNPIDIGGCDNCKNQAAEIAKLKAEIEALKQIERDRWTGWSKDLFHPAIERRKNS